MAKWSDDIGKGLETEVREIAKRQLAKFEIEAITFAANVINTSPIGVQESEGEYQANWQISPVRNDRVLIGSRKNGIEYANSQIRGFFTSYEDAKLFLFNNAPKAEVIEYGGFKKNPKRGTYNKYTGKFEKRSIGGFSFQAPSGHVRIAVKNFNTALLSLFK